MLLHNKFNGLAALALLGSLWGCPLGTTGAGTAATKAPAGTQANATDGGSANVEEPAPGSKESPVEETASQPVAMPGSVFSSGSDPTSTFVNVAYSREMQCRVPLNLVQYRVEGQARFSDAALSTFTKPAETLYNLRVISVNDTQFGALDLPLDTGLNFGMTVETYSPTGFQFCVVSKSLPAGFKPWSADLSVMRSCAPHDQPGSCWENCIQAFTVVPNIKQAALDIINDPSSIIFPSRLPECTSDAGPTPDDLYRMSEPVGEEPVSCRQIPESGLFRCTQGEEIFCVTLIGERRECPSLQ